MKWSIKHSGLYRRSLIRIYKTQRATSNLNDRRWLSMLVKEPRTIRNWERMPPQRNNLYSSCILNLLTLYLRVCGWYLRWLLRQGVWVIWILIVALGAVLVAVVHEAWVRSGRRPAAVDHCQVCALPRRGGLHRPSLRLHCSSPWGSHFECWESILHTAVINDLLLGLFWNGEKYLVYCDIKC